MKENEVFKCSHYNCGKSFVRTPFPFKTKTPPINDKDKFEEIFEGILITRLFCMDCSITHSIIICHNSNISLEEYQHLKCKKIYNK